VSPRNWRLRLQDILDRIDRIERYTEGLDLVAFGQDELTVDAVVYNFAVIGEAARHVPSEIVERYPQVPWADMRDMRNFIIHQYSEVSVRTLWETVVQDLPPLPAMLRDILEREP
jgi:uncharacterized protein with HEPN domain